MTIHQVAPATVQKWLSGGEAVLVDVREKVEYEQAHIAEARLLPLSRVTLDEAHLPEHRGKKLVLHCRSGKRSMMACEKLQAEDPAQDFYNMEGGIMAWQAASLPTSAQEAGTVPGDYVLDRRAETVIGVLLLALYGLHGAAPGAAMTGLAVLGCALTVDGLLAKGWFARLWGGKKQGS